VGESISQESADSSLGVVRRLLLLLALPLLGGPVPYTAPEGDYNRDGKADVIDIQCAVLIFQQLEAAGQPPQAQCQSDADCVSEFGENFLCRSGFTATMLCLPSCLSSEVSVGPSGEVNCVDPAANTALCLGLVQKNQIDLNCDGAFSSTDINFLVSVVTGKTGGLGSSDHDGDGRLNSCDDDSDGDQVADETDCDPLDAAVGPCDVGCPEGGFCPEENSTVCGTYNVPYLHVPAEVTVTCAPGCNQPVKFNVAGNVLVEGTINLSGKKGNFSFGQNASNGNPNGAAGGLGATGGCGGLGGGNGGHSPSSTGNQGGGPAGGGGKPGAAVYVSQPWGNFYNGGTGGGGGHGTSGGAGFQNGSTGIAGQGGASNGNSALDNFTGGSGGGSGSGGLGGASTGYGGAGGGAGGGALQVTSTGKIEIAAGGALIASGGAGGHCQTTGAAGGGGAGAGGAIWLSAPTVINGGTVKADGGTNCYANGGNINHGRGGEGRIRIDSGDGELPEGSFSPVPGHVGSYAP